MKKMILLLCSIWMCSCGPTTTSQLESSIDTYKAIKIETSPWIILLESKAAYKKAEKLEVEGNDLAELLFINLARQKYNSALFVLAKIENNLITIKTYDYQIAKKVSLFLKKVHVKIKSIRKIAMILDVNGSHPIKWN